MRIWHIDPAYLDTRRLSAAHNEIHTCRSCIKKQKRWGTMVDPFFHAVPYLVDCHKRIVEEMAIRDPLREAVDLTTILNTHPSPLEGSESEEERSENFVPTEDQLIKDVQDLRDKWEAEHYFYGVGRLDLRDWEREYHLVEGPGFIECMERKRLIREITKRYKLWFSAYRKVFPKTRLQDRIQAFLIGEREDVNLVPLVLNNYELAANRLAEGETVESYLIFQFNQLGKVPRNPTTRQFVLAQRPVDQDILRRLRKLAFMGVERQPAPQDMGQLNRQLEYMEMEAAMVGKAHIPISPGDVARREWEKFNTTPVTQINALNGEVIRGTTTEEDV